ncbi:MAG: CoB--CoM heterodisulfide reductase iron-sulfur subunit B family protein [Candidatus Micrarchaeia archaeon]
MIRYAFFPGCMADNVTSEQKNAARLVAQKVGIELVDFPEFSCCGARVIRDKSEGAELALNARNLAYAERAGLDMVTICSTCLITMSKANHALKNDARLRKEINSKLSEFGLAYKGNVKVKHFLWVLADEIELRKFVTRPLRGVRAAPFYGCHILRPSEVLEKKEGEKPSSFEKVIRALGATPISYEEMFRCCGFHTALTERATSVRLAGKAIESAAGKRADVLVTPCPFCHVMLDAYQEDARRQLAFGARIPVLHLEQLVGLALGLPPKELGLHRNVESVEKLLAKLRFKI